MSRIYLWHLWSNYCDTSMPNNQDWYTSTWSRIHKGKLRFYFKSIVCCWNSAVKSQQPKELFQILLCPQYYLMITLIEIFIIIFVPCHEFMFYWPYCTKNNLLIYLYNLIHYFHLSFTYLRWLVEMSCYLLLGQICPRMVKGRKRQCKQKWVIYSFRNPVSWCTFLSRSQSCISTNK